MGRSDCEAYTQKRTDGQTCANEGGGRFFEFASAPQVAMHLFAYRLLCSILQQSRTIKRNGVSFRTPCRQHRLWIGLIDVPMSRKLFYPKKYTKALQVSKLITSKRQYREIRRHSCCYKICSHNISLVTRVSTRSKSTTSD